MKSLGKYLSLALIMLLSLPAMAQDSNAFIDTLFSNGRIYVVVVCAAVVMLGIILFLVRMDRKISKLEKLKNKA